MAPALLHDKGLEKTRFVHGLEVLALDVQLVPERVEVGRVVLGDDVRRDVLRLHLPEGVQATDAVHQRVAASLPVVLDDDGHAESHRFDGLHHVMLFTVEVHALFPAIAFGNLDVVNGDARGLFGQHAILL